MNIYNGLGKSMQRVIFSEKSSLGGLIYAPPSKSHSHRLLFLALISNNPLRITKLLSSNDIDYSLQACKQLGMQINLTSSQYGDQIKWLECLPPKKLISDGYTFNCGNSGTTVRFLIGLSIAIQGKLHLTGEFFTRNRPFIPMLEAMTSIGTEFSEGISGVTIETPQILKSNLKIPGHFSSQFVSGLIYGIIGLCLRADIAAQKNFHYSNFNIETTSPQVSFPYIELTRQIFEQFGIKLQVMEVQNGCIKISIPTGKITHLVKDEFVIPGDYSAIAPLLCGIALFGKQEGLIVEELSDSGFQLNRELVKILGKVGVEMIKELSGFRFYPVKNLNDAPKDLIINCMGIPDLFPSLCVLGSYLSGTITLTNISHIRFKESNRVDKMVKHLRNFGIQIEDADNSVKIHGNPKIVLQKSHVISDIKDHRVLMALIVFAVGIEYNNHQVTIENVEYIADSYPRFVRDLLYQIGAKFDLEEVTS